MRVVVGVDGSDCARRAAQWAAREAEARGAPSLTLLHAYGGAESIPPPLGPIAHQQSKEVEGAALLETAVAQLRELHPTLAIETELSPLGPIECLVELSRRNALIVTGKPRARSPLRATARIRQPSVGNHRPRPLVVVRGPRDALEEGPIVLGIGPESAQEAVEYAFAAARRYAVPMHAVRAEVSRAADLDVPPPVLAVGGSSLLATRPPRPSRVHAAHNYAIEREIAEVGRAIAAVRDRYPDVHVEITANAGEAAETLNAQGEGARLLVLGAPRHHRRTPVPAGAGHVVRRVLARAPALPEKKRTPWLKRIGRGSPLRE